jgi:hypothetical protein
VYDVGMEKELDMNNPLDKIADLERQLTESRNLLFHARVRVSTLERVLEQIANSTVAVGSDGFKTWSECAHIAQAALKKETK